MISLAIVALLEHPDQLALLRDADDPKVIATAVEELMRYLSIIQTGQSRVAVEDIEFAGELIRGGEGIILDVPPANWDARRYPNPDQLDLQRETIRTSASATAGTNASDSSWPGGSCKSCCTLCCAVSRRCGWRSRWSSCRSNTTLWPTGRTNYP